MRTAWHCGNVAPMRADAALARLRDGVDYHRGEASSSASVRYCSSLQVMIFVIRFLLFVARPRRSGPFLRPRV
jgi:hypothetical protein